MEEGGRRVLPAPRAAASGAECTFRLVHSRAGTDVPSYPTVSLEHREGTWAECSPDLLVLSGLLKLCFLRWCLGPSLVHLS